MKSVRMKSFSLAIAFVGFAIAPTAANADESSLAKTGAALNDPLANVWALFTEFDSTWSEGDFSGGDHAHSADCELETADSAHAAYYFIDRHTGRSSL
jgi:hypothetical protein